MKVLFVCKDNIGRSQMAEAFFNKFSKRNRAVSCGTNVKGWEGAKLGDYKFHVVRCMKEAGISVGKQRSKQVTRKMFSSAQKVIAMAGWQNLPAYVRRSKKVTFWRIKDIRSASYEKTRKTRDVIRARVKALVTELG